MQAAIQIEPSVPLRIVETLPANDETELLPLVLEALASERDLFQQHERLVEIVHGPKPAIVVLDRYALRERLRLNPLLRSRGLKVPAVLELPMLKRKRWPGIRELKGLLDAPVLRPDGTVLQAPGYDPATGLYLTSEMALDVPATPTQEEARAAFATLRDATSMLPFRSPRQQSAFLSSLLTPFARLAVKGAAPLFLFDSPTDRGPSLLADVVSLLVRGQPMLLMDKPPSEFVFRRRLAQLSLQNESLVAFEGADSYRSGNALHTALFSRACVEGAARAKDLFPITWYSTTTNVSLTYSVLPLVLPVRVDRTEDEDGAPRWEAPDDFEDGLLRDRPRLISAVLTILRAYLVAGRPSVEAGTLARFPAWTKLIVGALVWAGAPDPLESRSAMGDYLDDEKVELLLLFRALALLQSGEGKDCTKYGMTVADIVQQLAKGKPWTRLLQEVLQAELGKNWDSHRHVGALFKKVRGRESGGLTISRVSQNEAGYTLWGVVNMNPKASKAAPPAEAETPESRESIHVTDVISEPASEAPESRESIHVTDVISEPASEEPPAPPLETPESRESIHVTDVISTPASEEPPAPVLEVATDSPPANEAASVESPRQAGEEEGRAAPAPQGQEPLSSGRTTPPAYDWRLDDDPWAFVASTM